MMAKDSCRCMLMLCDGVWKCFVRVAQCLGGGGGQFDSLIIYLTHQATVK
jgi:hypothetical protein